MADCDRGARARAGRSGGAAGVMLRRITSRWARGRARDDVVERLTPEKLLLQGVRQAVLSPAFGGAVTEIRLE